MGTDNSIALQLLHLTDTEHEQLVQTLHHIHDACVACDITLTSAESLTGGLISALLTSLDGSSSYFLGGVCSYASEVKTKLLDVPADLIEEHTAVSEPVARRMAAGALRAMGATYAIAVTGIAGPNGATPGNPVGTVYFAWGTPDHGIDVERRQLVGDRDAVRAQTCLLALQGLEQRLVAWCKHRGPSVADARE